LFNILQEGMCRSRYPVRLPLDIGAANPELHREEKIVTPLRIASAQNSHCPKTLTIMAVTRQEAWVERSRGSIGHPVLHPRITERS
jgi:hypothetical protein